MKVTYYSIVDVRSDFLPWQIKGLKTFCLDRDWEFVVLNNAIHRPKIHTQIEAASKKRRVRSLTVPEEVWDRKNSSLAHKETLKWVWHSVILKERPDIVGILDFDLFLTAPFRAESYLADHELAGWFCRNQHIRYLWPGLMLFDLRKLPNPETIDFDRGIIEGVRVDVGGAIHRYISKHPQLNIRNIPIGMFSDEFRVSMYDKTWIHYCKGSGWDNPDPDYKSRKDAFVFGALADIHAEAESAKS
jgi:hypothetical protein